MRAHHLAEPFWCQRSAKQVVSRLGRLLVLGLADAVCLANNRRPGPLMALLQPSDVRADCGSAGFDAVVIALN
jgi:hypothetical protein